MAHLIHYFEYKDPGILIHKKSIYSSHPPHPQPSKY